MQKTLRKLHSFLKHNKKALGLASSLIVLVSFTLKEGVSEYLKDEMASVKGVLAREQTKYDGGLLDKKLTAIENSIDQLPGHGSKPATPPWLDTLHQTDALFAEINEMADVLPDTDTYKRQAHEAFQEQNDVSSELLDYDSPQLQTPENFAKVQALHEEAAGLQLNVFGRVSTRKSSLEKESVVARVSIYVLFLFGWTLGLALTLVGEAPKAE